MRAFAEGEQLDAVHRIHLVIREEQDRLGRFVLKSFERQRGVVKLFEAISVGHQRNLGQIQQHRLVSDEKNQRGQSAGELVRKGGRLIQDGRMFLQPRRNVSTGADTPARPHPDSTTVS